MLSMRLGYERPALRARRLAAVFCVMVSLRRFFFGFGLGLFQGALAISISTVVERPDRVRLSSYESAHKRTCVAWPPCYRVLPYR